jgi:hypothetical protein
LFFSHDTQQSWYHKGIIFLKQKIVDILCFWYNALAHKQYENQIATSPSGYFQNLKEWTVLWKNRLRTDGCMRGYTNFCPIFWEPWFRYIRTLRCFWGPWVWRVLLTALVTAAACSGILIPAPTLPVTGPRPVLRHLLTYFTDRSRIPAAHHNLLFTQSRFSLLILFRFFSFP